MSSGRSAGQPLLGPARLLGPLVAALLVLGLGWAASPVSLEPDGPGADKDVRQDMDLAWLNLDLRARGVQAAPQALTLPQPASRTATPRISLPTASPDPRRSATPTQARSVSTPSDESPSATARSSAEPGAGVTETAESSASGGNAGDDVGNGAGSDAGAEKRSGVVAGDGDADASPGQAAGGSAAELGGGSGFREDLPAFAWSDGASASRPDPAAPVPKGIVAAPISDPGIRQIWADSGSPRQGQPLSDRFTEGRPGPWGIKLFYPLLAALFAWAGRRVWLALDAAADAG